MATFISSQAKHEQQQDKSRFMNGSEITLLSKEGVWRTLQDLATSKVVCSLTWNLIGSSTLVSLVHGLKRIYMECSLTVVNVGLQVVFFSNGRLQNDAWESWNANLLATYKSRSCQSCNLLRSFWRIIWCLPKLFETTLINLYLAVILAPRLFQLNLWKLSTPIFSHPERANQPWSTPYRCHVRALPTATLDVSRIWSQRQERFIFPHFWSSSNGSCWTTILSNPQNSLLFPKMAKRKWEDWLSLSTNVANLLIWLSWWIRWNHFLSAVQPMHLPDPVQSYDSSGKGHTSKRNGRNGDSSEIPRKSPMSTQVEGNAIGWDRWRFIAKYLAKISQYFKPGSLGGCDGVVQQHWAPPWHSRAFPDLKLIFTISWLFV